MISDPDVQLSIICDIEIRTNTIMRLVKNLITLQYEEYMEEHILKAIITMSNRSKEKLINRLLNMDTSEVDYESDAPCLTESMIRESLVFLCWHEVNFNTLRHLDSFFDHEEYGNHFVIKYEKICDKNLIIFLHSLSQMFKRDWIKFLLRNHVSSINY